MSVYEKRRGAIALVEEDISINTDNTTNIVVLILNSAFVVVVVVGFGYFVNPIVISPVVLIITFLLSLQTGLFQDTSFLRPIQGLFCPALTS